MFKRKKKGFTLIEMLVVIAIIAILVSVTIPAVQRSTTKAAAATNAANLRSVEGVIATMLVDNKDMLVTDYGDALGRIIEDIEYLGGKLDFRLAAAVLLDGTILQEVVTNMSSRQVVIGEDDKLSLTDGEETIVIDAPGAKALSIEGYKVMKGTQMTVVITENSIVANYDGMNAEAFALIAEGGDDTELDTTQTTHTYWDGNNDGVCDHCNGSTLHSEAERLEGVVGGAAAGKHNCTDEADGNCICDVEGCGQAVHEFPNYVITKSHKCEKCGVTTECNSAGVNADGHYCTVCGKTTSTHSGTSCSVSGCPYTPGTCGCTNYEATRPSGWFADDSCKNCNGHNAHSGTECTATVWRAG